MFGGKKGSAPQSSIDSLIGAGTRIEGNVFFSGGLRVDGVPGIFGLQKNALDAVNQVHGALLAV